MSNKLLITTAKILSTLSKAFNLGDGSTWPGHLALMANPQIIEGILKNSPTKIVLIVGTNGKTTTSRILTTILKENESEVIQNTSGANLLNGIASTLLLHSNRVQREKSYAVFEVDENNLPIVLQHISPKVIIALDLFRDQLDRYGELDSVAKKWNEAFQKLTESTTLILNSDDPLIAYLAKDVQAHILFFGLSQKEKGQKILEHASDSIYCPRCGNKLSYKTIFYSHLGVWECSDCHLKRPSPDLSESTYPLPGTYNTYNTLAAVLAARSLHISQSIITKALQKVTPAFGRQEKLTYKGKNIQLFLSKNPVSMNESLETIVDLGAKHVLFVLNDRIPDGRDVSWIWDIDIESYADRFESIAVSGDRAYDMALRLHYAESKNFSTEENLQNALQNALDSIESDETLYILPTYSAMLEVRKILTGKKIL